MVTSRLPTGNTVNRATQYAQDLRNNRALLCSISLSISDGLQCSYISDISRTYYKGLLPKKNLFDSRQCSIPQRSGSMELVLRTPGVYRSVQSSSVFSGVQCNRESLASYTTTRHTQSILLNPKRALFNFNFDLPKYPNESIANSGLFNSISIIDYVALFIQWYIVNPHRSLTSLLAHAFRLRRDRLTTPCAYLIQLSRADSIFLTASFPLL